MNRQLRESLLPLIILLGLGFAPIRADDPNESEEKAMKAASARVAASVVKIETAGGLEVIGGGKKGPPGAPSPGIARGTGPTTGLVVDPDGYVITSSFNFANKPSDIFVTLPDRGSRLVARVVATDTTRMLTLLKVDAKDLPVPTAYPKTQVRVGQWALSLGRTLDPNPAHPPSVSVGIVSAVNRLWGKAIQTDAKVSPANYGGPLVAIDGRVLGVLVPAAPRAEGETAGFEWYDSGIGFAIPLEDIIAKLPQMKKGGTLRRGLLGITPKDTDVYTSQPILGAIQPESAAQQAGLKVGDRLLAIDGKPVANYSAVQHLLGPKYEGDMIKLKVQRGDKQIDFEKIVLQGTSTSYVNAFLGILPMRDEPAGAISIRYVYPKSPADTAGMKEGDKIVKIGTDVKAMAAVRTRDELATAISQFTPGIEIQIEVKRKEGDKSATLPVKLGGIPEDIPEKLPLPSSAGKSGDAKEKGKEKEKEKEKPKAGLVPQGDPFAEPKKDPNEKMETGYLRRADEALGREYWLFVPDNYDAHITHGLIVWFHPVGQGGKDGEKMARTFRDFCETNHFIVMGPKSQSAEGWLPSETEVVVQDINRVISTYSIDKKRVIAHGMGNGGQMAFYVGFTARDTIRGVATIGATLGTAPKDNIANQPLAFFIAVGDKDPAIKNVKLSRAALTEKRFPVVYRVVVETGKEYLDLKTFTDLLNWFDSLDRL